MSAPKEKHVDTPVPMSLDEAADAASNIVTRFATPLLRLEAIAHTLKDAKNQAAVYEREIPVLAGRLDALKIEEAAATARVANAKVRADDAEKTSDGVVQDAALRAATARDATAKQLAEVERAIGDRRSALEADYAARKSALDERVAIAQRQLDALTKEYERLLATARSKFAGP